MTTNCIWEENRLEGLMSIRDALDVINGKWRIQIVVAIKNGCHHFNEIQRAVESISPKMLSKELKALEEHKLIVRVIENEYPVKITYQLEEYAITLTPIILALKEWGKQHRIRLFPKTD